MGTLGMLMALNRHWRSQNHPIFQIQKRLYPFSLTSYGRSLLKRAAAITSIVFFLFTVVIAIVWLLHPTGPTSLTPAVMLISVIPCAVPALAFLAVFLWPVVVAISTSRVIITEREAQTWDILLTIPMDWREVVLAKEAAALQRLPPYLFVIFWSLVSAFTMLIVTATVSGLTGPSDGLLSLIVAFALMAVLVIAGFQVYLGAATIGLLASLFTPTRQIALIVAALASFSVSLFTSLFVILASRLIVGMFAGLILPSFSVRLGLTATFVTLVVSLNEFLLRRAFRLLIRHLGDGDLPTRRLLRGMGTGD